jgi:hypothetical protein
MFDKKVLKKEFRKTAKAQEHAFLASLSDFEKDSTDSLGPEHFTGLGLGVPLA